MNRQMDQEQSEFHFEGQEHNEAMDALECALKDMEGSVVDVVLMDQEIVMRDIVKEFVQASKHLKDKEVMVLRELESADGRIPGRIARLLFYTGAWWALQRPEAFQVTREEA